MKKTVSILFGIVIFVFVSCTNTKTTSAIKPTDYYKKFDSACDKFIFNRIKKSMIDKVWIERDFNQLLQNELHDITWLPGKVWYNKYDSSHDVIEIMFLDNSMRIFFIRTLNTKYNSSIKMLDSVSIQGTMIGYHFDPKSDEDLGEPDFVAVADSIILLKRVSLKNERKETQKD